MRDSQRSKVYAAERAAFGDPRANLTLDECQALIDKWGQSRVLGRRYPRAVNHVEVRDGRGKRNANYRPRGFGDGVINMPRWSRSKAWLLHEWAHHLAFRSVGRAWHGWEFAECYLYLVRVFMGRGSEEVLKREFKAHRVKFRPPRKRAMSQQQRQAARERMLAMHARKREATPETLVPEAA